MTIPRKQLVKQYVGAIRNGHAALFVGAGLSRAGGFVDWKGLLRGCAEEIGLDLDREYDLVAVAQYYLNLHTNNRAGLSQVLRDEFDRHGVYTENHELIGRLPVPTVWTTNFDTLLEQGYARAGRNVDVKSADAHIAIPKKRRDVVLYKMHGDITRLDEIVICKADYERYARDHPVFQTTLEAELVAKTFLFLGFSFADPNLNYMLGHLHALLAGNQHAHFAVMRRARQNLALGDEGRSAFEYERNRQDLQIRELARYNIQTHLVDRFAEVTDILRAIDEAAHRKDVFVSGSADKYDADFPEERMRDLCMHFGELLMERDCKLISGIGLNIGDSLVKGALVSLHLKKDGSFEDHLRLRPFPRSLPPSVDETSFMADYRHQMIAHCGFAVFISGTSRSSLVSRGVMEEYRIARQLKKVPIPIGATGYAAARIWDELRDERETVYGGTVPAALYDRLNDRSLNNEQLLQAVFTIMERVSAL